MLRRPAFKNLRTARASAGCPMLGKSTPKAAFAARIPHCNNLVGYIQQYQRDGYRVASNIDPTGISQRSIPQDVQGNFELKHWQLSANDGLDAYHMDYRVSSELKDKCATMLDVQEYLRINYASNVAVEFNHVRDEAERLWLYENYEKMMAEEVTEAEKVKALQLLLRTEQLELFLQKRFATHKRYSSEGSEALLVALNALISTASEADPNSSGDNGVDSVVLGMPHRGRLATLVVLNDYPARNLLYKVAGNNDIPEEVVDRIDDIPTHIAVSNTKKFSTATGSLKSKNKKVTLTMVHNPSHLESQNAISMGKAKAKVDDTDAGDSRSVLNIQAHGDAAFCGQGAAYEALTLCKLPKFDIGGSIHIITNNQVGFTTASVDGRSFDHSSDIVKSFGIPVVRINAADGGSTPESLVRVCKFMVAYWKTFRKDILIDMIGYRKHGHNEVDEPSFTQPEMYQKIRETKSLAEQYAVRLVSEGVVDEAEVAAITQQIQAHFEAEFEQSLNFTPSLKNMTNPKYKGSRAFTHKWEGMMLSHDGTEPEETGCALDDLQVIAEESVRLPADFKCHPRLKRFHIDNRMKGLANDAIDWATAEAMALGTLNLQGFNTRVVGEDSERGTFSQRHAVFHDQNEYGRTYTPLRDNIQQGPSSGRFQVLNTNLNEVGTMAYEYGYSLESPKNLCMWEAQFGDFYNPAQLMIDQYLMCSEAKWLRQSGLVLLLPHGFDGAGPEHSTCHIERFLQNINSNAYDTQDLHAWKHLTAQNINFQVAQCTTPANYFHLLRRQMLRDFRKPLVLAAPKVGLKHPAAISKLADMAPGTRFSPIIVNTYNETDEPALEVVLCSGKIFFDINNYLTQNPSQKAIKVIRVEELAPFPSLAVHHELAGVSRDASVTWVQEEGMNQGAFQFAKLHIDRMLEAHEFEEQEMHYLGRRSVHSFCTGAAIEHKQQATALWGAFGSQIVN